MSEEHHDLVHEFPEYREQIHQLKINNLHFQKLFETHHDLQKQINRFEVDIEVTTDEHLEELKKKRLKVKDELFGMLQSAV